MNLNKGISTPIAILVIVILAALAGGIIYWEQSEEFEFPEEPELRRPPKITPLSEDMSCEEMYNDIESDLDNANYCQEDSDCEVIILGAVYIKFGCYHFINKSVDKEQIRQKMRVYDRKCRSMINKCAPAPDAQCVSGKCVPAEKK